MAPLLTTGYMSRAQTMAEEVDLATKWWNDYPTS